MAGWFDIRMKTEAKALNAVRSKILGWPEEVMRDVYKPIVQEIGREGAGFIREVVRTAPDKDGEGRIKSGKMINSVRSEVVDRKKGFTMNVGWIRGLPGYTIFQELGTRHGIIGMDAIQQAHEYMLSRLRSASKGEYQGNRSYELEGPDE